MGNERKRERRRNIMVKGMKGKERDIDNTIKEIVKKIELE